MIPHAPIRGKRAPAPSAEWRTRPFKTHATHDKVSHMKQDTPKTAKRREREKKTISQMIAMHCAGNHSADTLTEQVAILEGLLPKQISGDELIALIDATLAETGATTKKEMGRVMGALTQKTGGNFDKAAAAKELQGRLQ